MDTHTNRAWTALTLGCGMAVSAASAHPFSLSVASGSATITSAAGSGSGPWTIHITVSSGSPAVFTLTTSLANTDLDAVEVECDADCVITINESGSGTFAELGYVHEAASSSPESFEIDTIEISGSIGGGSYGSGIYAEDIDTILVGGDVAAAIESGPHDNSAESDIDLIQVGGNLNNWVGSLYGSIGSVIVEGDIEGLSIGFPIGIWARYGITFLTAESITNANIFADKAPYPAVGTGTISRRGGTKAVPPSWPALGPTRCE